VGGKGDLEKSRFDWVFINDGVPKSKFKRKTITNNLVRSTTGTTLLLRALHMLLEST
jgi:hypothetical protein